MSEKEEDDYKKGFVYEKVPEILTPGHAVMTTTLRIEKVMVMMSSSWLPRLTVRPTGQGTQPTVSRGFFPGEISEQLYSALIMILQENSSAK